MSKAIYPCLWFDQNAMEAADFYCTLFHDAKILQDSGMVCTFELEGTKFMAINGGPMFSMNQAVSYYYYASSAEEVQRFYNALIRGGEVLMPLDTYDWAEKYAWVIDKFGVSWQMDMSPINNAQKIVPCLLFGNEKKSFVKEARDFYLTIFKKPMFLMEAPFPNESPMPKGSLLFTQFKLADFIFNAMSNPSDQDFDFGHGNSFVIECEDQAEIDHYWEALGKGGEFEMCGWLKDSYGVSWQVIPKVLGKLMSDPNKAPKVMAAFMKMKKFDIATLENA